MDKKYWVPAVERAHGVLQLISAEPSKLKLIDLSKRLEIHKSSMFSLLQTMELLDWVVRDQADTYSLGGVFGTLGSAYFQQFDLISLFHSKAQESKNRLGETIQLAKLELNQVLYLAKVESPSPVRLISEPGMRFPAYATGLGKALLAQLDSSVVISLFSEDALSALTPHTLKTRQQLLDELVHIKENKGYAFDIQECVMGFCCVAAPIYNREGFAAAAVSFSIPLHRWEEKRQEATLEIAHLAESLSIT